MVQYEAPIRSLTLGPEILGEQRNRSTGQRKGTVANPSTGQTGAKFMRILD